MGKMTRRNAIGLSVAGALATNQSHASIHRGDGSSGKPVIIVNATIISKDSKEKQSLEIVGYNEIIDKVIRISVKGEQDGVYSICFKRPVKLFYNIMLSVENASPYHYFDKTPEGFKIATFRLDGRSAPPPAGSNNHYECVVQQGGFNIGLLIIVNSQSY